MRPEKREAPKSDSATLSPRMWLTGRGYLQTGAGVCDDPTRGTGQEPERTY